MHASTFTARAVTTSKNMHLLKPNFKFKNFKGGLMLRGKSWQLSNSLCIDASNPYLIGETYQIQPIQFGKVSTFVMKPENITNGIIIIGQKKQAVSAVSKRLPTTWPYPAVANDTMNQIVQKVPNCCIVTSVPIPNQKKEKNSGITIFSGRSIKSLAIQQGTTPYILLAYSLKNRGLSSMKTKIDPRIPTNI